METQGLRKCASIKSRKHPELRCPYGASFGEFCSRHFKNPIRYENRESVNQENFEMTKAVHQAARQLQIFWRRWSALTRFRRQGPAANCLNLAQNTTEVSSLDGLETIPFVFFFSFPDESKNIWAFDIRSLSHLLRESDEPLNPYTRQTIDSFMLKRIHDRLLWLRKRKYPILYETAENLTREQVWNQKVLDVFFKMENLGYRASCRWFEKMRLVDHEFFYRRIHTLWNYQLHLTHAEKEGVVPGYNDTNTKLFKSTPDKLQANVHDLHWWRKTNLGVIQDLLTRAPDKSQQSLGALYVLMALVQVVPDAATAYPWVLDTVNVH